MTLVVKFIGSDAEWAEFGPALQAELAALPFPIALSPDASPVEANYVVMAGTHAPIDFSAFTRCKALLRLWAGVEDVVQNDTITFPICRMVGGGLDAGMVEWVTAHVMRHHIGMDQHIHGQDGIWRDDNVPPLAAQRPVTILGLGALGQACGQALANLGFPVTGWSRSPKTIDGIRCLHGDIAAAVTGAQIVVTLLPRTPETENILNAKTFALMAKGAVIINPGRGQLVDDTALLSALATGHVSHATLDTFRQEPLPAGHTFWGHPQITVTPHIASATRPEPAAKVIAQNVMRCETGQPLLHLVDRRAGY
ncbi:glyoxylate/hydroxypyruvate reductase A [Octadecabacter sp.]|nr:glyoxylate/hydroxypyruvate reductase A [Octadecabacter sp.]